MKKRKLIFADDLLKKIHKERGAFATGEGNEPFMAWEIEDYIHDLDEVAAVVLPVEIGDTVYTNFAVSGWRMRKDKRPYKAEIVFIGINGNENFINVQYGEGWMFMFGFSEIGKTIFLTREEAEEALASEE